MDFTPSPDQVLLRDTARSLLTKECPPSLVRTAIDDPAAADPLWTHLREWAALGEGPVTDLCLFLEECGAALAPGPYLPTVLALGALRAGGVHADVADALAAGEASATIAMAGVEGVWWPTKAPTKAFVLEADRVDHVIAVQPGGLVAVTTAASLEPVGWLDLTRRIFDIEAPEVAEYVAATSGEGWLDGWLERAWVAVAAEMVGTARRILEMTVAYAKDRVQFGVPIGSFQAVQHKLADVAYAVERASAAVYYAAMCVDFDDTDRHRAAHVAKAAAGSAAKRAAKDGVQVHGGIGYTWEHDLHLYIRRAYASEHLLGTSAWHHDRLADILFS